MSMVPMAFANPFSPLQQSLIRTMPNAASIQPPIPASDQTNTMMRAHNLRSGFPGAGQMTPGADRSGGPMSQSVEKYKTLMMAAAGLSDEEATKFKPALSDPYISPQALQQLLQMHQKVKAGQQAPAPQAEQPNGGASIGGPTPANTPPGSIRITQGSGRDGRNVMSQEAMQQWMQRAQQTAPAGEQVQQISGAYTPTLSKAGMDEWNRLNPGQALPVRSTPVPNNGFQVSGIQPPGGQQPAQPADPMQGLFQAFKQAGIDDNGMSQLQSFAQAGATPQQVHQAAEHMLNQQQASQRRQQAEQQQQSQRLEAAQQHTRDMQIRQLQHQQTMANQMGKDEEVSALQTKIDSLMQPQRPPTQNAGQPTQNVSRPPTPPQPGHALDQQTAMHFMQMAGGDKNKARELAKKAGWSF